MPIDKLKKLVAILSDFDTVRDEVVQRIVQAHEREILEIQTDYQMYERGVDSEGKQIGKYTDFTKKIKRKKGQPYAFVTGKDTGEMYKESYAAYADSYFAIYSGSETAKLFTEAYGARVWGFDKKSTERAAKIVEREFDAYLRAYLNELVRL